jgi:hypothetical protein
MALPAIRINTIHFDDPGDLMTRFRVNLFAFLLLTAMFAGTAAAEKTLPVNDNNTGVFDQPSVAMDGSTAHVAFIGDNAASGVYRVFYAAVNGASDYANLSLAKDNTVILTSPVMIDNTGAGGNSPYNDARHPKIILRSSTEAVILFQAKTPASDTVYRPFLARLTLAQSSATLVSVKEMSGFPTGDLSAGDIEDLSFGIVTTDNTARIAFGARSAIPTSIPFHVYFARVGIDNASVVGAPLLLSSGDNNTVTGSDGFRPIPGLKLDGLNRAHVAWVSNDNALGANSVYYGMVKETNGVDNLVIAATQVIGSGLRWGHPNLMVAGNSSILILASDESVTGVAGNVGIVNINPDAASQDGTAVRVATNTTFFLTPPGELILPDEFNLYRPEAFLDAGNRIHMTGYGVGGSRCAYYAFNLITTAPYYQIMTLRSQVGFDSPELPGALSGDYTKAAFGYISGKVIVFWSGLVPGGGTNRNLDVTAVPTVTHLVPANESGCSMVADPRAGERGRIPGTAILFLPAVFLAVRRVLARITHRRAVAE